MKCSFKVGFFLVRECSREGAVLCSICGQLVCDAHQAIDISTSKIFNPVKCLRCNQQNDNDSDYSERRSSSSSSSSSSSDSFSGRGGSFGGAGASSSWGGAMPSASPAMMGATPSTDLPLSGGIGGGMLSPLDSSGISESDAALFDEVSKFDETSNDKNTYDS